MNQTQRNGEIDVLRFIFIVLIILGHIIKGTLLNLNIESKLAADIGVEFFFIVSGYLLCKHYYDKGRYIEKDNYSDNIWKYTLRKASYIYTYILLNVILSIIIRMIFLQESILDNLFYLLMDLPVLLFINIPIHQTGTLYFTGQWFLSALFVSTFIIYALIIYKKELFIKIISPIIAVFIYGYMMWKYKTLISINLKSDFIDGGILRGIAGMSLGVFAYNLSQIFVKINLNKLVISIFKNISFVIVIYQAIWCNPKLRFSIIVLLFFAICFSFGNSYKINSNIITNHLAKLSMIMYICHSNVIYIFHYLNITYENEKLFVAVIMIFVIILAEVYYFIVKIVKMLLRRYSFNKGVINEREN